MARALGRAGEAEQADRRAGERVDAAPADITGSSSGVGSIDLEEVVDVDRLGRQPAAHDVVAGAHQLDAGAAEVGVEVAGAELDRLAGLELRRS